MNVDLAREKLAPDHEALTAQVCIIGGGVAGLLLADKLASAGVDVVLLEAGGTGLEPGQPEATAELAGLPHAGTAEGRTRALGGSSLVWGGQLLPMREGVPWPVSPAALASYYGTAEALLGVDGLPYEAETFLRRRGSPGGEAALWQLPRTTARLSKFAPFSQRNLGASLGRKLLRDRRVRVVLHASVLSLASQGPEGRIDVAVVRSLGGQILRVRAEQYVLAAGTVETCRLLLASGGRGEKSSGNRYGQVGLNFHDHLTVEVARFTQEARTRAIREFRPWIEGGLRGTVHAWKLEADERLRRALDLNHAVAHITFEEPAISGAGAVRSALRERQQSGHTVPWQLARALPTAVRDVLRLEREARREGRRYTSAEAAVTLRVNVAQRMPSSSRILLSETKDAHGEPLARMDWHTRPEDLRSVRVFAAYLCRRWARLGLGTAAGLTWRPDLVPDNPPLNGGHGRRAAAFETTAPIAGLEDARHPMGGACMGTDPRTSVVDTELRVHGVENLWVASAAVFPDGQPQLPTLTLMALTLRLADRLQEELQRSRPA